MKKKIVPLIKEYLSTGTQIEIIIFIGVFFTIVFYAYNYLTRLNTAYRCFDKNETMYLVFFNHPSQNIIGENRNWVKDGISNYDKDDWSYENFKKQNNQMHYYYKNTYSYDSSYFEFKPKRGEKFTLPVHSYRTVVFDSKQKTYRMYEYKNFRYQTEKFLLNNTEDESFKIPMKITKELKCSEDKEMYDKLTSTKIGDLIKN